MSILSIQRPRDAVVQILQVELTPFGQVPQHAVHGLGLVELVLARGHIFRAYATFTQINVPLIAIDTKNHGHLIPSHTDKFVDGTDATTTQFRKKDETLDVVVFEEGHVGAHVGNGSDIDHDETFDFRIFGLVETTVEVFFVFREVEAEGAVGIVEGCGGGVCDNFFAHFLLILLRLDVKDCVARRDESALGYCLFDVLCLLLASLPLSYCQC
mmetsp:Transcript_27428/g.46683  ORF Transcript_27428/g.46683 Transcript_27428/m.46683 type:complete len:213 (+) Transcript_27428:99-737(+)